MRQLTKKATQIAAVAALAFTGAANAALILDNAVTSTFTPFATSTGTDGNDLPGHPSTLYYGQLKSELSGFVDFYYIGNEAAYTNSLIVNDVLAHSSANLPDNFLKPYPVVGSTSVTAGSAVDFGFCTDGGNSVGAYGKCAYNDVAASLTAQYNYGGQGGYRSIGFRSLSSFDPAAGLYTFGSVGPSNLWMVFWDDSGAKNDDNHDDYIAVAKFRPLAVAEPSTALLLGAALFGLGFVRLRRRSL